VVWLFLLPCPLPPTRKGHLTPSDQAHNIFSTTTVLPNCAGPPMPFAVYLRLRGSSSPPPSFYFLPWFRVKLELAIFVPRRPSSHALFDVRLLWFFRQMVMFADRVAIHFHRLDSPLVPTSHRPFLSQAHPTHGLFLVLVSTSPDRPLHTPVATSAKCSAANALAYERF